MHDSPIPLWQAPICTITDFRVLGVRLTSHRPSKSLGQPVPPAAFTCYLPRTRRHHRALQI